MTRGENSERRLGEISARFYSLVLSPKRGPSRGDCNVIPNTSHSFDSVLLPLEYTLVTHFLPPVILATPTKMTHVLLCGPPFCGKTAYFIAHQKEGDVHVTSHAIVDAKANVYYESNEPRSRWIEKKAFGSYFSKVVYWESVDSIPLEINKTPEEKEKWLWFWGFDSK
jgi:hypothetical protein